MNKIKEECSFGTKCYRLNPIHFKEFSHAHLSLLILELGLEDKDADIELPDSFKAEVSLNTIKDQIRVLLSMKKHDEKVSDFKAGKISAGESSSASSFRTRLDTPHKNKIADKWKAAAPFHMFMTKVPNIPGTLDENLSIGLSELFDESFGDVQESLQINFMVDINFLMKNLSAKKCSDKPMLILYETSNIDELKHYKNNQVKAVSVKPKTMFGHHHTKMTIILYKDNNIRVVISTANLIEEDWNDYSQGVWISPSCPPVGDSSKGESSTGFRASLASYLSAYKVKDLDKWIQLVKGADFSQVNVCFVGSVPSTGSGEVRQWGLGRLKFLLQKYVPADATEAEWPALIQCSSIGSLGTTPCEWVESQLKSAMLGTTSRPLSKTPLHLIYPCKKDVERSISGGGCLPYGYQTHRNQLWISEFVHKWRADSRKRNLAMPHIKTYCRVSPDWRKAAWFLLTSANMSKAAWGRSTHQGSGQNIMSYEGGVLFLPQLMIGRKHFEICHGPNQDKDKLPFPYDLPPTKYDSSDKMWLADYNVQS